MRYAGSGSDSGLSPIRRVVVVVPAKNEEDLLGECLESVRMSRAFLEREACGARSLSISVMVVVDACTDGSERVARSFSGVHVAVVDFSSVGAARAHGVALELARSRVPLSETWIANTDADSVVPLNWIAEQRRLANEGWDVVIGTVRPRRDDLDARRLAAWDSSHSSTEANGHVHGANLGVRADRYRDTGGFSLLPEHEDVELVEALRRNAAAIFATNTCEVVTSGRVTGRTPGGYAGYLRALSATADLAFERDVS